MKSDYKSSDKKQAIKLTTLIISIVTIIIAFSGMVTALEYGTDTYSDDYAPENQQVLLINNSDNVIAGLWEGNNTGVYYYNNSSTNWEKESGINNKTIAIQRAVDNSTVENDTIIVGDGTYNGTLSIDNSNVTELKSHTNKPVIDGLNDSYTLSITVDNVNVSGFNFTNSSTDIVKVINADKINITNNDVINGTNNGVYLNKSNNSNIQNNNLINISSSAIFLDYSNKTDVSSNHLERNKVCIHLNSNSNYNNLSNNDISNSKIGIGNNCDNNNITSNVISKIDQYTIYLSNSDKNNITDNEIVDSYKGLFIFSSSNNKLEGNEVVDISGTIGSDKGRGVVLGSDSNSNNITGNKIKDCEVRGISLLYFDGLPDNNLIYNNYLKNDDNAYVNDTTTGNKWNTSKTSGTNIIDGPYLGGNYWATPSGDGFSQTNSDKDGDGICESEYPVNSTNVDYLPLTTPNTVDEQDDADENDGAPVSMGQNQPSRIVKSTETAIKYVQKERETKYDFSGDGSPVSSISFEAKKNAGRVVATSQELEELPDDVKDEPTGSKYITMSITVGREGTVSDDNADNIQIEFEVTKDWVKNNNIDPSTIRMERYHNGEWQDLPTNKVGEDEKLLHFTATTPGFSVFTVVGDEIEDTSTDEEQSDTVSTTNDTSKEPKPDTEAESEESTPGFTSILALGILGVVYTLLRRRK